MHELVTTLIPTYQRKNFLRRAVLSACSQTHAIVHVFDNASDDGTESVVRELQSHHGNIEYTKRPENIGALANFIDSVKHVKTPYFSLLSDDDYLLPDFYSRAVLALESNSEAKFWAGVTINVGADGKIWDARMMQWPRDGLYTPPEGALRMCGGLAPTWTGIVFRTAILHESGFIDPETLGPSDLDFTLRLACRYAFYVERVPVAVFSLNPASFSATSPLSSFWPGWLKMLTNIENESSIKRSARQVILSHLNSDAKRMLFRRGLNALAASRHDFAMDAASALRETFSDYARSVMLDGIRIFAAIPGGQRIVTSTYRWMERGIIRRRRDLHSKLTKILVNADEVASEARHTGTD
jgi:glycosyltransferase involved in cell wall biosynthesis